jgi:hypothetical protein
VVALLLRTQLDQPASPGTPGPAPPAAVAPAAPAPAFPAPPRGAVVLAGEAGDWAVGLAFRPDGRRIRLQASVVGPEGSGVDRLRVRFRSATAETAGRPCGPGCYLATRPFGAPPARVVLLVGRRRVSFAAPEEWPPKPAGALVRRATAAYENLRSLTIDERLASAPGNGIHTHWRVVAPDRLEYAIVGGSKGIVIGDERWDRASGGAHWIRSSQTPTRQPAPYWGSGPVRDAYLVRSRGSVRVVSFYAPALRAWFTVTLDAATARPSELSMTATSHFMHHRYGSFDAPLRIEPPN